MDERPALSMSMSAELNKLTSKRMEIFESTLAKFKASVAKLSSLMVDSEPNIKNNKLELISSMLDELSKLIVTVQGIRDAEETMVKSIVAKFSAKQAEMKSMMAGLEAELAAIEYKVASFEAKLQAALDDVDTAADSEQDDEVGDSAWLQPKAE